MLGTTEGSKLLSKSGQDLLDSGQFSDAEVSAGRKVWRVHKTILCPRSKYFDRAFNGRFAEAKTGKLIIRDQTSRDVYHVLQFLYTGQVPCDRKQLTRLLELYKIADYFGIDSLQADILIGFETQLQLVAYDIWKPQTPDAAIRDIRKHWTDEELNEFFSAAQIAFTDSPVFEPVRKRIITFLKMTCIVIGKDFRFIDALKGVPDLAVAMVELLMDSKNQGAKSLVCSQLPTKCERCASTIPQGCLYPLGQAWISQDIGSRRITVKGLCYHCCKREDD
ncbi:BTB/POZ domain-containing protein [Apiospora sp. TS-2023a]